MAVAVFNPPAREAPPRAKDLPYVKGCYEQWAQWCHGVARPRSVSSTGRLIQGVRGTVCPGWLKDIADGRAHDPACLQCHGTGKIDLEGIYRRRPRVCPVCENQHPVVDGHVRMDLPTEFLGERCFRCLGVGFIVVPLFEVNPATIRSTRYVGGCEPLDVCLLVDELVIGWMEADGTRWLAKVVRAEFFWNDDQDAKARRLRISVSFFEKRLREAYFRTERMLEEKMP